MAEPVYVERQPIPGTPYIYLKTLGVGGHGAVFSVEHAFLKHRAVMKVLHAEHGADAELVRRSTEEGRILARMEHPNIVRAHDGGMTGEDPPRPFFVMDALQGVLLYAALKAAPSGLGFAMSTQIILGVLDGLDFAHAQHKVIHRDIKPANIFIHRTPTDTTVPKILDFGIAHFVQKRQRHTGRGFLGTPRYTAPEQIRGEKPTARTDLYAVGLVFYECLTGRDPFADIRDYPALIHAHLSVAPRRLSEVMDGVPADLDAMVACLLAKDPAARPESAASAAIALRVIKERLDQRFVHALDKPEFRTEPTPLDNTLITTVAKDEGTNPPSEPRLDANDTVPGAPPFTDVIAGVADVLPTPASGLDSTARQPLPPVDRLARTRTGRPPFEPGPRDGTTRLAHLDEPAREKLAPAVTETPLVTASPVARTRARGERKRGRLLVLGPRLLLLAGALGLGAIMALVVRSASERKPSSTAATLAATTAESAAAPSAFRTSSEPKPPPEAVAVRATPPPHVTSASALPAPPTTTPARAAEPTPRGSASTRRSAPRASAAAPPLPAAIGFD